MSRQFGLGYIPDNINKPHFHTYASVRRLSTSNVPDDVSMIEWACPVLDQGGIGSCGPHAATAALWTALNAAGTPLPWIPSQADLYRLARCIGRGGPRPNGLWNPLADGGVMPAWLFAALNSFGCRPMKVPTVRDPEDPWARKSDCSLAGLNDEPMFNDVREDAVNMFGGQYQIDGTPSVRGAGVRVSLAHKLPPIVCSFVDTKYMHWTPEQGPYNMPDYEDPDGGGHAQMIVAAKHDPKHGYLYLIQNSWGVTWCDAGRVWVTEAFLGQADDLDATAFRRLT